METNRMSSFWKHYLLWYLILGWLVPFLTIWCSLAIIINWAFPFVFSHIFLGWIIVWLINLIPTGTSLCLAIYLTITYNVEMLKFEGSVLDEALYFGAPAFIAACDVEVEKITESMTEKFWNEINSPQLRSIWNSATRDAVASKRDKLWALAKVNLEKAQKKASEARSLHWQYNQERARERKETGEANPLKKHIDWRLFLNV
jgi:hypothetical protein